MFLGESELAVGYNGVGMRTVGGTGTRFPNSHAATALS